VRDATTPRIGAYLGIGSDRVNLHCGVIDGAKALGIDVIGRGFIEVDEFPSAFRLLSAAEI
jgi:hypothetical protein